jgi:hypothetical protein
MHADGQPSVNSVWETIKEGNERGDALPKGSNLLTIFYERTCTAAVEQILSRACFHPCEQPSRHKAP